MAAPTSIVSEDGTKPLAVNSDGSINVNNTGGTGTSATQVQGTAAHNDPVAANPVLIGVEGRSSDATAVTSGDVVRLKATLAGQLATAIAATPADAVANGTAEALPVHASTATGGGRVGVFPYRFNGTTWDRQRNNTDLTILSSAARTADVQSADFVNYNGKGLHLVIDVTADPGTASVVFTIQGKDAISGKYYTILQSATIDAVGTTVLKVYPGITASANASASDLLPRTWRVDANHTDAESITYSVGASVIL